MKNIKLLDCTLRDGGYINDWKFGQEHILDVARNLEDSRTDIIELGFIRNEPEDDDRTVFNSIEAACRLVPDKIPGIDYAVMAEVFRPLPLERISPCSSDTVDIIRVIVWKDLRDENGKRVDALQEGYEYCKGIVEKGYRLFVQPARAEQYSDREFESMLNLFASLSPEAVYIVDSWGTMHSREVLHYLELADRILGKEMAIGFHGHNNMMQAFSNAVDFIHAGVDRKLILDASVYGLGRGAGNLNTEVIAEYLNQYEGKRYKLQPLFNIYENCIKDLGKSCQWGYSSSYFVTALHHANPQYGMYYGVENSLDSRVIDKVLGSICEEDRVIYSRKAAERFLQEFSVRRKKGK